MNSNHNCKKEKEYSFYFEDRIKCYEINLILYKLIDLNLLTEKWDSVPFQLWMTSELTMACLLK